MKKFEELRDIAFGNFWLVTATQARGIGIASFELSRWVKKDWLEAAARGVYRLSAFPSSEYDPLQASRSHLSAALCLSPTTALAEQCGVWTRLGNALRRSCDRHGCPALN